MTINIFQGELNNVSVLKGGSAPKRNWQFSLSVGAGWCWAVEESLLAFRGLTAQRTRLLRWERPVNRWARLKQSCGIASDSVPDDGASTNSSTPPSTAPSGSPVEWQNFYRASASAMYAPLSVSLFQLKHQLHHLKKNHWRHYGSEYGHCPSCRWRSWRGLTGQ